MERKTTYEELEDRVRELEKLLSEEPTFKKVIFDENGIETEIEHWAVRHLAYSLWDTFDDSGAVNFITTEVGGHPKGPIEVTLRPCWGNKKTPAHIIGELKLRIAELEAEIGNSGKAKTEW